MQPATYIIWICTMKKDKAGEEKERSKVDEGQAV